MRKKIIGIILLVLIIFGGYKLFANVSANNVNSKSIHFFYDDITEYKGDNPYVYVNDNKPYFTGSEIKDECYLKYGPLDSLKRGTSAIACINYDSMPAEDDKKGDSDSIHPTGWNNATYEEIGGACQVRTQIIPWCFGGSDTDKKNYITASPYMADNMNVYVVKIARYLEETSNHVMYRVTPIFNREELMCRGVLMEAYSVEDNGEGICFNVFLYNVQPGLDYIYSTGESKYTGRFIDIAVKADDVSDDYDYILNNRSMLIHKHDCENALRIGTKNKIYSYADKSELIQVGYRWAECCKQ